MAKKIGAGYKSQNYDKETGQYAKDGASSDSDNECPDKVDLFKEAEEVVSLSKQEWAKYYKKLGEIKAGNAYAEVTDKGNRMVVIDNNLIFDNNSYVSPRVKKIFKFNTEEELTKYLKSRRKK